MSATFKNVTGPVTITLGSGGQGKVLSVADYGQADSFVEQPVIVAADQRAGTVVSLDEKSLTGITDRQWQTDAVDSVNGTTATLPMSGTVTCIITCDQGTITTPGLLVYMAHATASHNTMDDAWLALTPHNEATHIATSTGLWSAGATWDTGSVPGDGAVVLIPAGLTVTYDIISNPPRLDRVRVDGTLIWSQITSTGMTVETVTVTKNGTMQFGASEGTPVPDAITHDIIISGRDYRTSPEAASDINIATDPLLLGRGIIGDGTFHWYGRNITRGVKTTASSWPVATDTSVTLTVPADWTAGDEICVPGTFYTSSNGVVTNQNEYRPITSFTGSTAANFTDELVYDHDLHSAVVSLVTHANIQPSILNITSNVTITSEVQTPNYRRGHCMFMHSARPDLQYVRFQELGRTHKAGHNINPAGEIRSGDFWSFDSGTNRNTNKGAATAQSNIQSRYPFHFHHCGRGRSLADEAHAVGCVVYGTPGWGMVQHACDANFEQCVVVEWEGAGFVNEEGSELGTWYECFAAGTRTQNHSSGTLKSTEAHEQGTNGDFFRFGAAFASRARMSAMLECEAYGAANGFIWFHRFASDSVTSAIGHPKGAPRAQAQPDDLVPLKEDFKTNYEYFNAPLVHANGNFVMGCINGGQILKSEQKNEHDFQINLHDWTVAVCQQGFATNYIGGYLFRNWNVIGSEDWPTSNDTWSGMTQGGNVSQVAVRGCTFDNFKRGIEFKHTAWKASIGIYEAGFDADNWRFSANNNTFTNCVTSVLYTDQSSPVNTCASVTNTDDLGAVSDAFSTVDIRNHIIHEYSLGDDNNLGSAINADIGDVSGISQGTASASFFKTDATRSGTAPIPKSWDRIDLNINPQTNVGDYYYGETFGYWKVDFGAGAIPVLRVPFYHSDSTNGLPEKDFIYIKLVGDGNTDVSLAARDPVWALNGSYTQGATKPSGSALTPAITAGSTETAIEVVSGVTGNAGASFEIDSVNRPDAGRVSISGTTLLYTPLASFTGTDKFVVYIRDDKGCVGARLITCTVS